MLATLVQRDPKAPFSIAATPRCREGCYLIMLGVKSKAASSTIFESLVWLDHCQTLYSLGLYIIYIYIYIYIYDRKSTREPINISPDAIKSMRRLHRINTKIWWPKMSILFNQICINEEMLPKYTHIIYIYIYIYI